MTRAAPAGVGLRDLLAAFAPALSWVTCTSVSVSEIKVPHRTLPASRVEEEGEGGAGSRSSGAPHPRMGCLYNFLQNIIASLHILKEIVEAFIGLESTLHVKYHAT